MIHNNITGYNKSLRYAEKLIKQAAQERDTKGYRENLGYDSINRLQTYLGSVRPYLHYQEEQAILGHFHNLCDKL